jgi:hypothetical protein
VLARFAHSRARCGEIFDQVIHSTAWSIFARTPPVIRPASSCLSANSLLAPTLATSQSVRCSTRCAHPLALRRQPVASDGECAALVPICLASTPHFTIV